MKLGWISLVAVTGLLTVRCSSSSVDADSGQVNKFNSVLVKVGGKVGKVCSFGWDDKDAQVVCRQEGWEEGVAYLKDAGTVYSVLATSFNCSGEEVALSGCPHRVIGDSGTGCDNSSTDYNSASAYCFNSTEEPVFSLEHYSYGRVRVAVGGYERYLCDDIYAKQFNAALLCKELGYKDGEVNAESKPLSLTEGAGWWKATFECKGTEPRIAACRHDDWSSRPTQSPQDYCSYMTPEVYCYDNVRLHPPFRSPTGVLGVFHEGEYRGVCGDNITQQALQVACSTLGFSGGQIETDSYNISSYNVSITNVSCTGTEKSFRQCSYNFSPDTFCSQRLVLACNDTSGGATDDVNDASFELIDFNSTQYGRVAIRREGERRYLCDEGGYFNYEEVKLVCKQLGFITGHKYPLLETVMGESTQYWANDINCLTEVPSIDACVNRAWSKPGPDSTCRYGVPAVFCYGTVRLNTDFKNTSGRVQVYKDKSYQYVCAAGFDSKEINVMCSELGFVHGGRILPYHSFSVFFTGFGNIPIGYQCTGSEGSLTDCTAYDASPCDRPATVGCYQSAGDRLRDNWSAKVEDNGRVVVSVDGVWGTICYQHWQDEEAEVLCKSLGYTSGRAYSLDGDLYHPMLVLSVSCGGQESTLSQCSSVFLTDNSTSCNRLDTAAVHCSNQTSDTSFELVDFNSTQYGRVAIRREGERRYLCDEGGYFNHEEVKLVCKQLGFITGHKYPLLETVMGESTQYWANDINCLTEVPSIDACVNRAWSKPGPDSTCRYGVPAVFCYGTVRLNTDFKNTSGRVQVYKDKSYQYVCATGFDSKEINVMCSELGFVHGGRILPYRSFSVFFTGFGNIPIGYQCTGSEGSLMDCTAYDASPCDRPATVGCYQSAGDRLRDNWSAKVEDNGRVVVSVDGVWGTICYQHWQDEEAEVLCKSLGYTSGRAYSLDGDSYHPMLVLSVSCGGQESTLSQCSSVFLTDNSTSCNRLDTAAVHCSNQTSDTSFELVDFNSTQYGRVAIRREGERRYLCDEGGYFNHEEVKLVCKQLGFITGHKYPLLETVMGESTQYWANDINCLTEVPSIDACVNRAWSKPGPDSTCRYGVPAVFCYGTVRLNTDFKNTSGRVQVYKDKSYQYVCAAGFDSKEINVMCSFGNIPIGYQCTGSEGSLMDCTAYDASPCDRPATVGCYQSAGDRLRDNWSAKVEDNGRVVVSVDGVWGTICYQHWQDEEAEVLCKSLGYTSGRAYSLDGDLYHPMLVLSVSCGGQESTLSQCSSVFLTDNSTSCNRLDTAAVHCLKPPATTPPPTSTSTKQTTTPESTRFIAATNTTAWDDRYYVSVLEGGEWSAVCSYGMDETAAGVFCRELGYEMSVTKESHSYYDGVIPWLSVACSGSEQRLFDCPVNKTTAHDCMSRAQVYCYNNASLNQYRLSNGSKPNTGWVEVYRENKWGLLCDKNYFGSEKASKLCKTLGYVYGDIVSSLDSRSGPVWSTSLSCFGDRILHSCKNSGWAFFDDSSPSECSFYPKVYCYGYVRLSSQYDEVTGALLVHEDDQYKTICSDGFDDASANVTCRQLGYSSGGRLLPVAGFEQSNPLSSQGFTCSGTEKTLSECSRQAIECSNPDNIVNVACNTGSVIEGNDGDVRVTSEGVVQVFYYGMWGLVCSSDWGDSDADVVCRETGHLHGKAYKKNIYPLTLPTWLFGTQCSGGEAGLKHCQLEVDPSYEPRCKYGMKAMAYCFNDTSNAAYSLTGGGTNYGYVQLEKDGKTGYICNENGPSNEVQTACRTLGFVTGDEYNVSPPVSVAGWWKNDLSCLDARKPSLELCAKHEWEYVTSGSISSGVCAGNTMSSVYCYGQFRLHAHFANSSGIVLHSSSLIYYTICSTGFDMTAANIVCQDLGFNKARLILPDSAYHDSYEMGYSGLDCPVGAVSMKDCSLKFERNVSCSGGPATIACDDGQSTVSDGLVRLADDGRVEVSQFGVWGVMGDRSWDDIDAEVVCRQMGFDLGKKKQGGYYTTLPMWMYDVNCEGAETSIVNCAHSTSGRNSNYHHARVSCFNSSAVDDFKLEFGYKGRLIKSTKGRTGHVCNTELSDGNNYKVICRTLGFSSGEKYTIDRPSNGSGWWRNTLSCPYGVSILEECEQSSWQYGEEFSGFCSTDGETLSVYCYDKVYIHSESPGPSGVVAMDLEGNGYYQTVCGDGFTEAEGRVACREAGFSGFVRLLPSSQFHTLRLSVHSFAVSCSGDESSLSDCDFANKTCSYRNYAAVECLEGRLSTTASPETSATSGDRSTDETVTEADKPNISETTKAQSSESARPNQPAPDENNSKNAGRRTVSISPMVTWFLLITMMLYKLTVQG